MQRLYKGIKLDKEFKYRSVIAAAGLMTFVNSQLMIYYKAPKNPGTETWNENINPVKSLVFRFFSVAYQNSALKVLLIESLKTSNT